MQNQAAIKPNLINIFKVFLKIGMILLGGGYVIIPIMEEELVQKRSWITNSELMDLYCVSQCLPGIIAINISILVGYKLKKIKGVLASVFGMAFSPFISIVIVAALLDKIMALPYLDGIFWGVNIAVIILIYLTLKEMWKNCIKDWFCLVWFFIILALSLKGFSPVLLIITAIVTGLIFYLVQKINCSKNKKGNEND